MNTIDYLKIDKIIRENKLLIKVGKKEKAPDDLLWDIKIMHENEIIFHSGFTNMTEYDIPIKGTGKFIIFCQAREKSKILYHFRDSIWFYNEEEREDYRNFYTNYRKMEEKIPFSNLFYPYQNIAVVFSKGNRISEKIKDIVNKINSELCVTTISNNINGIYLISEYLPVTRGSKTIAFSGKTKYSGQFIYGQNDIPQNVSFETFLEEIGYFSIFWGDSQYFEITNDYFGTYPLYSYNIEDFCTISNSFHLTALLAKLLGYKLTLNIENILPYFVTGERMMFEQLASHRSFIYEIEKIPVHSKCILSSLDGLTIRNKPIGDVMEKNIPFDEDRYYDLIKQSAKEITDNIKIILNDKRVDDIIVDVTGGKDSRVVLGGVLNCNCLYSDKNIYVYSKDVSQTNDKDGFIPLNHIHKYPYDTSTEIYEIDDILKKEIERRSISMGTQFNRSIPWDLTSTRKESIKKIHLTGAGGEMLLCSYFPKYFKNVVYDNLDEMIKTISPNYNNGIVDFEKEKKYIEAVITNGIKEVYGTNLQEMFNNYYLYFRNVYHFGSEMMLTVEEMGKEKWTPLYSKSIFLIRQMVADIDAYKGIKVAVDLLNELAPNLLKVPFSNPDYNKELEQILKSDKKRFSELDNITVTINRDDSEWIEAQKEKNKNCKVIKHEELNKRNNETIITMYERTLNRLNKMLHYDKKFEETVGLDLYIFFRKHEKDMRKSSMSRDLVYMYNKITTVSDLIDLVVCEQA